MADETEEVAAAVDSSTADSLTIGEAVIQLASLFGGSRGRGAVTDHGLQIAILDRGFVYIGKISTDAEWVYIKDASNIRRWGTTKGLGELIDGPTKDTVLDKSGNVKVSRRALIAMLEVKEFMWAGRL